jgi:hypothetical protein
MEVLSLMHRISSLAASGLPSVDILNDIASETISFTQTLAIVVETEPGVLLGTDPVLIYTAEHTRTTVARGEVPEELSEVFRSLFVSPIRDGGRTVGEVHLYFGSAPPTELAPFEFVQFLGQQFGGVLSHEVLRRESGRLRLSVARIRDEINTRKLVDRASGLLASQLQIPIPEAQGRLRQRSLKTGRSLLAIASEALEGEERRRTA